MKKLFLGVLLATIILSCETQTKNNISQDKIEQKKEFIVKIKFKTNRAGEFKLALYNIMPNQSQNEWIQINEMVAATTFMDSLTANFGENISNSFRIDLDSKEVKEVQIEWIKISYGKKEIRINSSEIKKYFSLNGYISQDDNSQILKTRTVESKHNPQMFLKKEYLIDLEKE